VTLVDLAILMLRLGALSFGGGVTVLPEMQRELVSVRGAMTANDFGTAYALGQATPGPGTLYLIPIGFRVAGVYGALVAVIAFIAPPIVLQVLVAGHWDRLSRNRWIQAVDKTIVPISIGLIGASVLVLGRPLLPEPASIAGLAIAALAVLRLGVSPTLVVLATGVLGLLGVL
jgi:chromate transporter